MTREESAKWAALLQAQADGKQLQRVAGGVWMPRELVGSDIIYDDPDGWRIATDLPPKPSQEWLDNHGVELTDEFRYPGGDLHAPMNADLTPAEDDAPKQGCICIGNRWILRRRAPQVRPWTIDTVPMPLVVKSRAGTIYQVVCVHKDGVDIACHKSSTELTYKWLLDAYTQRYGSPCGEVVK